MRMYGRKQRLVFGDDRFDQPVGRIADPLVDKESRGIHFEIYLNGGVSDDGLLS